jgi:hypothetical protein
MYFAVSLVCEVKRDELVNSATLVAYESRILGLYLAERVLDPTKYPVRFSVCEA